jgi:hypothetical protein
MIDDAFDQRCSVVIGSGPSIASASSPPLVTCIPRPSPPLVLNKTPHRRRLPSSSEAKKTLNPHRAMRWRFRSLFSRTSGAKFRMDRD